MAKERASVRMQAQIKLMSEQGYSTHGSTKVHSLQGELFYQLGGTNAVKSL